MELNSNKEIQILKNSEKFKFVGGHKYHINLFLFFAAILAQLLDILNSYKRILQQRNHVKVSFSLTYDNQQFLIFCFVFFLIGSVLNLYFGIYTSNGGYIVNGILLGAVSIGVWQVRKIATLKMKV